MDEELDKTLNHKSNFKYVAINALTHVRLLLILPRKPSNKIFCSVKIVPLTNLSQTHYKALSYTWGHAFTVDDIQEIQVDRQQFFIRQNLFDFLNTISVKGESELLFIDAICINQLDNRERQSQVQEISRIYRNADETIAWLGVPDPEQLDNVRALSQTNLEMGCVTWTTAQHAGFRDLSYHKYWSRIWIIQEVLLASNVTVWCGPFTFPLALFVSAGYKLKPIPSSRIKSNDSGRLRTAVSALSRLYSPAEMIISHRQRLIFNQVRDPLGQGTNVGTLSQMIQDLSSHTEIEYYQSQISDPLYLTLLKFGKLDCSDPRDKLYGLLGILAERSRAKVRPDYTKDVSYAYYQALKIGLEELYLERGAVTLHPRDTSAAYLQYYCDVRDAFKMADGESISILQQVLRELDFQSRLRDAILEVQWQQMFVCRDAPIGVFPDFKQLLNYAESGHPGEYSEREGLLFQFHQYQYRMFRAL